MYSANIKDYIRIYHYPGLSITYEVRMRPYNIKNIA